MSLSVLFSTGCLFNESSGPYLSLRQTVRALNQYGYITSVVGTRGRLNHAFPSGWEGDIHTFQRVGLRSMHYAPALSRWLNRQPVRWDVVSLQSVWLHVHHAVAAWCLRNDRPFMVTPHGNFNPIALGLSSWKKYMASKTFMVNVLRHVACFQATTPIEYRILRDFGIKAPICVIGNGIELPEIQTLASADEWLPEWSRQRRTCLYLGRLDPIKGIDNLIKMWANVHPTDDWQLVIAGSGSLSYEAQLKKLAIESKASNVHFIGPVFGALKSAWIQQADFMALLSRSEAFPMTLLEGFALRRPFLLTQACGLPEAARVGAAVEVATEADIVDGVRWFLNSSQHDLRAMGTLGFHFVEKNYTWPRIVGQLDHVYQWLSGGGETPECVYLS